MKSPISQRWRSIIGALVLACWLAQGVAAPAVASPRRERILKLPEDKAMAREADLQDREGRFVEAAALFRKAFHLPPHRPIFLYRAGRALFMAGQVPEALEVFYYVQAHEHLPKALRAQVELEIGELSGLQASRLLRIPPRPGKKPTKVADKPKQAPEPTVPSPTPIAAPPVALPTPPTPVAAPQEPTPTVPPVVVQAPKASLPPPRLEETPHVAAPRRSEPWHVTGTIVLCAASAAAIAGIGMAAHASSLASDLDTTHLVGSDVFDLSRTTKQEAVDGTNRVRHWYNGALGSGLAAMIGVGVGAWLLSGDDPDTQPEQVTLLSLLTPRSR